MSKRRVILLIAVVILATLMFGACSNGKQFPEVHNGTYNGKPIICQVIVDTRAVHDNYVEDGKITCIDGTLPYPTPSSVQK